MYNIYLLCKWCGVVLGLRLLDVVAWHTSIYGWVRISVSGSMAMTILCYSCAMSVCIAVNFNFHSSVMGAQRRDDSTTERNSIIPLELISGLDGMGGLALPVDGTGWAFRLNRLFIYKRIIVANDVNHKLATRGKKVESRFKSSIITGYYNSRRFVVVVFVVVAVVVVCLQWTVLFCIPARWSKLIRCSLWLCWPWSACLFAGGYNTR